MGGGGAYGPVSVCGANRKSGSFRMPINDDALARMQRPSAL
jgi:hypothetical protein